MFNFNVGFLQDIPSCEMKNFDGPIWSLKDMSVGLTAFRTEYSLLVLDNPKPKSKPLQADLLSPRLSYKHSG